MIELPEAVSLSRQLNERVAGKTVAQIESGTWPHKFAWYYGKRESYAELVTGRRFGLVKPIGGMVEAAIDGARLLFSEGVNVRFVAPGAAVPQKRQLGLTFTDGSSLVASVQMYGGMGVFPAGTNDNPYYLAARERPSPLSLAFDAAYFARLLEAPGMEKQSAKGFLATEQRIPGLGNGVLQDILFTARVHPRKKVGALDDDERERLFDGVRNTLREMAARGGRDTELDLYGKPGGYRTILSRNTVGTACPTCKKPIEKASYMGGAVYFCPQCQPL